MTTTKIEDLLPDARGRAIEMLRIALDPVHKLSMSEIAKGFQMDAIREHLSTITTEDVLKPTQSPEAFESVHSVGISESRKNDSQATPAPRSHPARRKTRSSPYRMTPQTKENIRQMILATLDGKDDGLTPAEVRQAVENEFPGVTLLVIERLMKQCSLRCTALRPKRWAIKKKRGRRAAA